MRLQTLPCVGRVVGRKMWFVQGILELLKNEHSMGVLGEGQAGLSANRDPGAPWNPTIGLSVGLLGDQE